MRYTYRGIIAGYLAAVASGGAVLMYFYGDGFSGGARFLPTIPVFTLLGAIFAALPFFAIQFVMSWLRFGGLVAEVVCGILTTCLAFELIGRMFGQAYSLLSDGRAVFELFISGAIAGLVFWAVATPRRTHTGSNQQ